MVINELRFLSDLSFRNCSGKETGQRVVQEFEPVPVICVLNYLRHQFMVVA
jgi:hypothetical protein